MRFQKQSMPLQSYSCYVATKHLSLHSEFYNIFSETYLSIHSMHSSILLKQFCSVCCTSLHGTATGFSSYVSRSSRLENVYPYRQTFTARKKRCYILPDLDCRVSGWVHVWTDLPGHDCNVCCYQELWPHSKRSDLGNISSTHIRQTDM